MKELILILLTSLLFSGLYAQDNVYQNVKHLYIEINDTVETAYYTYMDGWTQDGFHLKRDIKKDSIGVDSVRIKRIFYIKNELRANDAKIIYGDKKIYLNYREKEYINGCSSYSTIPKGL